MTSSNASATTISSQPQQSPSTVPPPSSTDSTSKSAAPSTDSTAASSTAPAPFDDDDSAAQKKSNYYFFKSTPAEEAARYKPQKIDESQLQRQDSLSNNNKPAGSAWNSAGTWEERDLSKWAHDRLSSLLMSVSTPDKSVQITSIKSISGDATIVFSRGKKKFGYDLTISAEWTLTSTLDKSKSKPSSSSSEKVDDKSKSDSDKEKDKAATEKEEKEKKKKSKEICGKITLPCIDTTVDEGEHVVEFSCEKESDEAQAALQLIRKQKSQIIKLVDEFVTEFKQQ